MLAAEVWHWWIGIVLFLASLLAVIVGLAVCLVGVLVAYPVVGIAAAFAYRKLQGEEVAA